MRSKEEINKELIHIDGQIAELCYKGTNDNSYAPLREKAKRLREELRFLKYRKIATDYEIDIYDEPYQRGIKNYYITPHNVTLEIGFIKICYIGPEMPRFGHVGYEIDKDYRGHNFTIKALNLLVDEMHKNGLDAPTFAVKGDNYASLRVVEKFGGEVIKEGNSKTDINLFRVNLTKKLEPKFLRK